MSYDGGLAERIREILVGVAGISEKKMFGGLAFMSGGHLFVGIVGEALMARVGPPGYESDEDLSSWLRKGRNFVASLPAKD